MARWEVGLVHSVFSSQANGGELFRVTPTILTAAAAQHQTCNGDCCRYLSFSLSCSDSSTFRWLTASPVDRFRTHNWTTQWRTLRKRKWIWIWQPKRRPYERWVDIDSLNSHLKALRKSCLRCSPNLVQDSIDGQEPIYVDWFWFTWKQGGRRFASAEFVLEVFGNPGNVPKNTNNGKNAATTRAEDHWVSNDTPYRSLQFHQF